MLMCCVEKKCCVLMMSTLMVRHFVWNAPEKLQMTPLVYHVGINYELRKYMIFCNYFLHLHQERYQCSSKNQKREMSCSCDSQVLLKRCLGSV